MQLEDSGVVRFHLPDRSENEIACTEHDRLAFIEHDRMKHMGMMPPDHVRPSVDQLPGKTHLPVVQVLRVVLTAPVQTAYYQLAVHFISEFFYACFQLFVIPFLVGI